RSHADYHAPVCCYSINVDKNQEADGRSIPPPPNRPKLQTCAGAQFLLRARDEYAFEIAFVVALQLGKRIAPKFLAKRLRQDECQEILAHHGRRGNRAVIAAL